MKEKLCAIKTRVALNPFNTYAYINTFGRGLDSDNSPLRIKPLSKVLIHEININFKINLHNAVVGLLMKNANGLFICHLIKSEKHRLTLKTYNPEKTITVPVNKVQRIYSVDDSVLNEEFGFLFLEQI